MKRGAKMFGWLKALIGLGGRPASAPVAGWVENVLATLNHQVEALYREGSYDKAIPLARRSLDLAVEHLGECHPASGKRLSDLAVLLGRVGAYDEAEVLYRRSLEASRTVLGEEHPEYATTLCNLAELLADRGDYVAAEAPARRSLEIRRRALGDADPAVAHSLNNLALLHERRGDVEQARMLFRQAVDLTARARGEDDPRYVLQLSNLASTYNTSGDYAEAESLLLRCLATADRTGGVGHPFLDLIVNNLADLYRTNGDYASAIKMQEASVALHRQRGTEDTAGYLTALNNLADVYLHTHNLVNAVRVARVAQERAARLGLQGHPEYARSLGHLTEAHLALGDLAAAKEACRLGLDIVRRTAGEASPAYATELANLARVHHIEGDLAAATSCLGLAREVLRGVVGEAHPEYARVLHNLAAVHEGEGRFAEAESLYREALAVLVAALGEGHPDTVAMTNSLAGVCAAAGRTGEAFDLMTRAAAAEDRLIDRLFSFASDKHRLLYLQGIRGALDRYLSLAASRPAEADVTRAALDLVLRRKGLGAEMLVAQRNAVLGGRYPHLADDLRRLTGLRREIARKSLAGSGPEGAEAHREQLDRSGLERERLEADLARQMPELSLEARLRAADQRAVAAALPEEAALVEFVRYAPFNFQAVPARGESPWQPARYLAFVLPAGQPDHVRLIDLGEAEPIDRMVADFRADITGEAEKRASRDLGAVPVEPARAPGSNHGPALRAAVFDKLVPALAGCKRFLLAPDGDLTRLPFEVLPNVDGRLLIEEYNISYVSCGRDVLRFGAASNRPPAEPVVAADPDFDLSNDGSPAAAPTDIPHGRCSRDLDRGLRFGRLKGTRLEGERIAALLGVKPWLDATALESRLKACRSPRILHLATHGFFLADQKRDPNKEFRDLGALPGQESAGLGRLSGSGLENPLLRSGLALAGANTWLQNGNLPAEAEDGLLTAEDVSGLDLLDTDLVVLSACETGLGEVHIGEGVFGLRRAFVLAGAKTLVMSLWKVPDQQTQELMEDFYRRLLDGQPRAEALRQAQLALKARYPNPLFWGAFICQGDPAPLPQYVKPKQATSPNPETIQPTKPAATGPQVRWPCPGCGKTLQATGKPAGKKMKCPKCGNVHSVPASK
jgi:CHAT domain-containing protein/tetratricopeptide (TPR) repeat protein/predicted RNA-binding Zn-ribbon protein involved in translation (DUF1610 family)